MKNMQKLLTILCLILAALCTVLYFLSSSTALALTWLIITILWSIDLGLKIKLEQINKETYPEC